jgi:hypothetical protein
MRTPFIFCMQGAVGANLRVRPVMPGIHAGLPLQMGKFIFGDSQENMFSWFIVPE